MQEAQYHARRDRLTIFPGFHLVGPLGNSKICRRLTDST